MSALEKILQRLDDYVIKGEFKLYTTDVLSRVCNIPIVTEYSGVYLFYDDLDRLIYVGISGRQNADGNFVHRKNGLRGRFLTGKQFGDARRKTLPIEMRKDRIKFLKIKWYITYCWDCMDVPRVIEKKIIEAFKIENNGSRPMWNKKD